MKKHNTGKKLKATVAVILVMASLFAMTLFVHAGVVERILGDATDEINLTSSRSQYMTHYEVTETWSNGNIKTITYWSVDRVTGERHGEETYTSSFPEDGDDRLRPYGEENGFKGCFCPNCVGLYT